VQSVVQRRWRQPSDLGASDRAIVLVRVTETGRIMSFSVESCSGGTAFCESVRQTMDRLSSLPRPPDADAVRGGVRIRFEPD
jgi:colicin import membrane protein